MTTQNITDAAAASLPIMVIVVLIGAIVPILPTGAAVSASAVLALHSSRFSLVVVVLLATVAAFIGDCVVFELFRLGGPRLGTWLGRERNRHRFEQAQRRLLDHGWQVLVVSRLIPAGRIPTLVAASVVDYPWARFVPGEALAALVWAVMYAALGVLGGKAFANPLVGVVAAILLVILLSLGMRLYQRWSERRHPTTAASTADAAGDVG